MRVCRLGIERLEGKVPVKAWKDRFRVAKLGMSEAPYSTAPMLPANRNTVSATELHAIWVSIPDGMVRGDCNVGMVDLGLPGFQSFCNTAVTEPGRHSFTAMWPR